MLLECCCNGRFAGGGQAGEPYGAASLLAEVAAFLAGKARVPRDVAGVGLVLILRMLSPNSEVWMFFTYVAIFAVSM